MLITCPECQNEVSDKAPFCPKCGYVVSKRKKLKGQKKLRLPNGFGRITKISNKNLRNPYRVMVTVGTDENGRPIGKILKPQGYFKTYNDAYQALMEYHKTPFDLAEEFTLEDVYERWLSEYEKNVSKAYVTQIKSAWKYCDIIKREPIRSLKPSKLKFVIDNGVRIDKKGNEHPIPLNTKLDVKSVFLGVFSYAIERDLVDRNIAKDIVISKEVTKKIRTAARPHINYSDEELKILWDNKDEFLCRFTLIQCYSGWRPGELLDITLENIDLENWTMKGGNKTENGIDRIVPIHSKIRDLVKDEYETALENGLTKLMSVKVYKKRINPTIAAIGKYFREHKLPKTILKEHRGHDGRVTFVSLAKRYNVDEYAIKRIVGHSISDLTEKIYTIRDLDWLRNEIEKIK